MKDPYEKQIEETERIDLHNILQNMLPNYVHILLKERLNATYELLSCHTRKGDFIYACPNHANVLGFHPDELNSSKARHLIHPNDIKKVIKKISTLNHMKEPVEINYRIKHKHDGWIGISSICTPYEIAGKVIAFINFSRPYMKKAPK